MGLVFSNKLVAVLNEKVEPGVAMNALAHMCMGFGARIGVAPLRLTDYRDADGGGHPGISEMPIMILRANSNRIRALRQTARDEDLEFEDFTDTMTVGTYLEQMERTQKTRDADLV